MNFSKLILSIVLLVTFYSCQTESSRKTNLLTDVAPAFENGWVNMLVEIPAGTTEKWEVNKATGSIERDSIDGHPRTINYLGYPGNYGFIPQTLLPKEQGGDGDPLDVLVIGESVERGTVIRCKIIGVLKLTDTGEQDDKLIAIAQNGQKLKIKDLAELQQNYPSALNIIETWFVNYKRGGKIVSSGYGGSREAYQILEIALSKH